MTSDLFFSHSPGSSRCQVFSKLVIRSERKKERAGKKKPKKKKQELDVVLETQSSEQL